MNLTLGIEEELMVVDPETGGVVALLLRPPHRSEVVPPGYHRGVAAHGNAETAPLLVRLRGHRAPVSGHEGHQ